ncbi:MAG TPA: aminoglycoside phosphotransferase family protein [Actinomycetota bacterium]
MGGELPHPGLAWLLDHEDGRGWLERLPRLVDECAARWALSLEDPYPYAMASLAMPAIGSDGERVVLKVQYPDREGTHEAAALRRYDGNGAVRLLDEDPDRWAMLLERAEPGDHLSTVGGEAALEVLVGLLPRLSIEADEPFTLLEDEAAWWADTLRAGIGDRDVEIPGALVDEALAAIEELSPTQAERVLLHQDLHGDNVVAGTREPWLAIDPKPLVGERAFAVAPIVRSYELGHSREETIHRLDVLCDRLDLDRERARRWAIAQTVAWCDDERHLAAAVWLLDA